MEWTIVTVIVVLAGLVGAFMKPLLKWNASIVENTVATRNLTETMRLNEQRNEKEHDDIWDELDRHDERITIIEHKGGLD